MKRSALVLGIVAALALPMSPAVAQEVVPVDDLTQVEGLSAEQLEAVASFVDGSPVSVGGQSRGRGAVLPMATRRASYYRGSVLMWTRDNVDFGYDWSRVTWTSPFQQAGWIWPNISRNRGITKYYDTVKNDRFRALNTIGAGVPTPWGDVLIYSSDFVHRLSVNHNGAWSAWSD